MTIYDNLNELSDAMSIEISQDLLFKAEHGESLTDEDIVSAFALAEERMSNYRLALEQHIKSTTDSMERDLKILAIDPPRQVREQIAVDRGERLV